MPPSSDKLRTRAFLSRSRRSRRRLLPQVPEHVVQDAAVAEIFDLVERVDAADAACTVSTAPSARWMRQCHLHARLDAGRRCRRCRSSRCRRASGPCGVTPSLNCSGSTPMPTRFERWMRSKLSAITARTPSSSVPLAAQSRDEPVPYSLPAMIDQRHAARLVLHRRVVDRHRPRRRACSLVMPPSMPGAISFLMRMLAKVPRIITSWLPRRAP